jgi:thiamine biosynthesis protein ThiI
LQGRLLLEVEREVDLRKVFGIVSYSPCSETRAELESMCLEALELAITLKKTSTFRISTKRITKEIPLSSVELNHKIGEFIVKKTGLKVDLSNPVLDIGIEIIGEKAFVFDKTITCFGGLPVSIEGKVLTLLSDESSLLAALLMMKRGCAIEAVLLKGDDFDNNMSLLQKFSPQKLVLHRVGNISELRELANKLNCKALVVNDTLTRLKEYCSDSEIIILRPLIAFSEEEIRAEAEKYQSIL